MSACGQVCHISSPVFLRAKIGSSFGIHQSLNTHPPKPRRHAPPLQCQLKFSFRCVLMLLCFTGITNTTSQGVSRVAVIRLSVM